MYWLQYTLLVRIGQAIDFAPSLFLKRNDVVQYFVSNYYRKL